jgi:hypothetical protein
MPSTATVHPPLLRKDHTRAIQIIARSLFRELKEHGYTPHHVIALSTELIQLVTDVLKGAPIDPSAPH